MIRIFILSFSLIFVFSACRLIGEESKAEQEPTILPGVRESPVQGLTENRAGSPIATPTFEAVAEAVVAPAATSIPQPTAGKGSVTGVLNWGSESNTSIAGSALLYLGPALEDDQGRPRLVSIDLDQDPTTTTDEFGRFAFTDVEPGVYGLIYVVPELKQKLLTEYGTGDDLLITIEADRVMQLGRIEAEFPF